MLNKSILAGDLFSSFIKTYYIHITFLLLRQLFRLAEKKLFIFFYHRDDIEKHFCAIKL